MNVASVVTADYMPRVEMGGAQGVMVMVKQRKLVFQREGVEAELLHDCDGGDGGGGSRYLVWSDRAHEVRSPITVSRIQPL